MPQDVRITLSYATRGTVGGGRWRARIWWAAGAAGFSVAAAGHVVLYRAFAQYPSWLPKVDEPDLFWMLVPPALVMAYTLMAVLSDHDRERAWCWLPPAIAFAALVGGFIGLITFGAKPFNATTWNLYLMLLGGLSALTAVYLWLAFGRRSPRA